MLPAKEGPDELREQEHDQSEPEYKKWVVHQIRHSEMRLSRRPRHRNPLLLGRLDKGVVVAVGLPGIGDGKAGDGLVHAVALAEVSGDGCRVARLGVCEREGPPAKLAVLGQGL